MARWERTSHGSSRKTEMWTGQLPFFRNLLWTKETMGQNTKSEASTFSKLLMKRAKQNDLCKVPACTGRAWLVHIWKDVPSTRPNLDLLASCVVRWLADPYETQGRRFRRIPYTEVESQRLLKSPISAGWASTFSCFNYWLNHRLLVFVCIVVGPLKPWRSKSCLLESSQRGNGSTSASCRFGNVDNFAAVPGGRCGSKGQKLKTAECSMQVLDQNLVIKNWNINAGDYFTSLQLFFHLNWNMGVITLFWIGGNKMDK